MAQILLVDDDESLLALLKKIVDQSGHKVELASGTQEALNLVKDVEYQVIFLDLNMPGYDGHDFIKLYRSTYPERHTPIVVLSADRSPSAYSQALSEGANDFLLKPIQNKLSLLRLIEKYCAQNAA